MAWIVSVLSIHASINGHLGWFHLLPTMSDAVVNTGVQICVEFLLSTCLGRYSELELLDYTVTLCLNFLRTAKLFTTAPALFYTHPHSTSTQGFQSDFLFNPKPWQEKPLFYSFTCSMVIHPFIPSLTRYLWTPVRGDICGLWPTPSRVTESALTWDLQMTNAVTASRLLHLISLYSYFSTPHITLLDLAVPEDAFSREGARKGEK